MAKTRTAKPKNKKPADRTDKVKPSEVMKMPPEGTVRSVAADIASTRKATGRLTEELKDIIADAKKDKGIHPGSLKRVEAWVAKAKKTDRGLAAVATELAHLDYYRDVLGLDDMIKKQGQMFARVEAGETEDDGQADLPGTTKAGPKFGDAVARLADATGASAAGE